MPQTSSSIRRWLLSQQLNVVATPDRKDSSESRLQAREAYCLSLRNIFDFEMPDNVVNFRNEHSSKDINVNVHVTFFDFAVSSFYGNTYVSPNLALPGEDDALDGDDSSIWDVKQLIFFTTTRRSAQCYAIVEVVATTFDRSTSTERKFSMAWAALPLFATRNVKDMDEVDHEDVDEDDFDAARLFVGTPRALMFYGDEWKQKATPLSKKKSSTTKASRGNGCKLMYSLHTCLEILKARHLIDEDFLFGPTTPVPGLVPILLPNAVKLTPSLYSKVTKRRPWTRPASLKLDTPSTVDVSNFTLTLPRGMDSAVRRQIGTMKSVQGNVDDLTMIVRIGVHNGTYLTRPSNTSSSSRGGSGEFMDRGGRGGRYGSRSSSASGGLGGRGGRSSLDQKAPWTEIEMREGSRGVYRASVRRSLPHWFKDSRSALVFEVVYTMSTGSNNRGNRGNRGNRLRDSLDDRSNDTSLDILGSRTDALPLNEVVVATGIFLPYDGSSFDATIDASGINGRSNSNSR